MRQPNIQITKQLQAAGTGDAKNNKAINYKPLMNEQCMFLSHICVVFCFAFVENLIYVCKLYCKPHMHPK